MGKKFKFEEVLGLLSDGKVHGTKELAIKLVHEQGSERFEVFHKRVRGHLTYLKKKGLATNIRKGCWIIIS